MLVWCNAACGGAMDMRCVSPTELQPDEVSVDTLTDSSTWNQPMNSDRIYQGEDDRWYFNVRGNQPKGPFVSYTDAEESLNIHVRQCRRPLAAPSWAPAWSKALKSLRPGRRELTTEPRHP